MTVIVYVPLFAEGIDAYRREIDVESFHPLTDVPVMDVFARMVVPPTVIVTVQERERGLYRVIDTEEPMVKLGQAVGFGQLYVAIDVAEESVVSWLSFLLTRVLTLYDVFAESPLIVYVPLVPSAVL